MRVLIILLALLTTPTPEPKACIPGATNSGDYDLRRWVDDGSRYGRWEVLPCDAPPPPPTPEPGPPLTPRAILFPIFGP